jgi:hypothetical protein
MSQHDTAVYDEGYRDGTNAERARWQDILQRIARLQPKGLSP